MPRHSSYRSNHGLEPVGNDWSSSQLIIGIAVAIGFGVICFATGYVIALNDNPLEPVASNMPAGAEPDPVPAPPAPGAAEVTPAANPTPTVVPPQTAAPAAEPAPAPAPAPAPGPTAVPGPTAAAVKPPETAAPAKPADTVVRTGLRTTPINALPEPGGPTPMVRTPVDMNKAPTPKIEPVEPDESTAVPGITPPAPAQVPAAVASNKPSVIPPTGTVTEVIPPPAKPATTPPPKEEPVEKPTKTAEAVTPPKTPAAPAKPAPVAEKPAAPTVTKGSFGIQVASFDGPQRSAQAKEFQRNIKAKAQQDSNIVIKDDGNYHTVVVPGFDTREAAKAACEKMKSKPGLEGAWVVRLP